MDRLTRRRLLTALAALPATGVAVKASRRLAGAAPALRPLPRTATSADRCAQCGSDDHAMLTGDCPAGPQMGLA